MSTSTPHGLDRLLADSYAIYLKTQNYHWNVTGPWFKSLHDLFEEQYTELAAAIDEIAERVRTIGAYAPGGFKAFAGLTSIEDASPGTAAKDMVRNLLADNRTLIANAKALVDPFEKMGDDVTVDLLLDRISVHEKTGWMLESLLED